MNCNIVTPEEQIRYRNSLDVEAEHIACPPGPPREEDTVYCYEVVTVESLFDAVLAQVDNIENCKTGAIQLFRAHRS